MNEIEYWQTVGAEEEYEREDRDDYQSLNKVLTYDAKTGHLHWNINVGRWGRIVAGSIAGSFSHGYRTIVINQKRYPAHRIAWLLTYKVWPTGEIDHINGNRADNRLANLRDVPKKWNGHNRKKANADNKSCGFLGVTRNGNGWMGQITVDGKRLYLGTFKTPEQAHAAYIEAKRKLHDGCTI